MIFIHELGHFTVARLSGITIYEFAIGMGPTLVSWKSKKYNTKYSLRLLPMGGFVSMAGEDGESDDPNAFNKKPIWKRLLILFAGPGMNLILGFVLMLTMLTTQAFVNKTDDHLGYLSSNTIADFVENSTSNSENGLQKGDKIIKVGNVPIHTGTELFYEITHQGYKEIDLTVNRDGQKIRLQNVQFGTFTEEGIVFGSTDFIVYGERSTVFNLIKHSFFSSISAIKMVWDGVTDLIIGRYGVDALSGPIGITGQIGEAARQGIVTFLYFFAIITINLGVMNLLPFPALDGGRILFIAIEGITKKKINPNIESYIHFIGLMLLFALMIFVSFKDVLKLILR
jgi:regulator of sigma E protease